MTDIKKQIEKIQKDIINISDLIKNEKKNW